MQAKYIPYNEFGTSEAIWDFILERKGRGRRKMRSPNTTEVSGRIPMTLPVQDGDVTHDDFDLLLMIKGKERLLICHTIDQLYALTKSFTSFCQY